MIKLKIKTTANCLEPEYRHSSKERKSSSAARVRGGADDLGLDKDRRV